ncbi:MAG: hypothetical protein J5950_02330 [Clostridia bacterium]|nr:hypothetical protein [Clostridia bacterium]
MRKHKFADPGFNCFRRLLCVMLAVMLMIAPAAFFAGAENEGGNEQKMIIPTYIFDFTDSSTFTLGMSSACTVEETDDGLLSTVIGDDPQFTIGEMYEKGTDAQWIAVKFRGGTEADKRTGELYFATEDKEFSEKTRFYLKWGKVTEDWQTLIVHSRMLEKLDEEITSVRFDPYTNAGAEADLMMDEWLEVAYIAFFRTEEDAKAFDYDMYSKPVSVPTPTKAPQNDAESWEKPSSGERYVLSADNVRGTFSLTSDRNAGTLTVSYGEGENKKVSVVPDNAFFRNGPLSGTDDLGRTLPDQYTVIDPDYVTRDENDNAVLFDAGTRTIGVYGQNGQRYVGIFYFLWHGTMTYDTKTPRNIQQLLDQYGTAAKDMPELWGRTHSSTFYFSEPLYGYYRSDDEWVIRRHMELLINAGVDFLYFDTTNNFLYERTAVKIMEICHELNEQGYAAPKVVFYTHTEAEERVLTAYKTIYEKNLYPDTWLILDGKPLIIAPRKANIDNFFTIRVPQWPNEGVRDNSWPWIDFDWPQKTYGKDLNEAVSVSVAQHNGNIQFSSSSLYGYRGNRGRSYDGYGDAPTEDSYKNGTNFALQLNRAITSDVPYVLVTGWNEWIANRMEPMDEEYPICFMDTFDLEYSRDVEMSAGGYFDNYYMQLAAGAAAIRGAAPEIVRDDRHAIDIAGDFAQWDQVEHYYTDPSGDAVWRDARGVGQLKYTNETGRNDIVRIKVTNDASYLYFYAECADNIKRGSGSDSWMQLMLNVDGSASGWYGYDYIACFKTKGDNVASLAKASGSGYDFSEVADVSFQVSGNKMMVAIPLEALGLKYFNRIALGFKWIDSYSLINTAEQFYTDGDCAPIGRPDFTYRTFAVDAEPSKLLKTVAVSERKAAFEKEQKGIDPIEYESQGKKAGWVLPVAIAGGAAVLAAAAGVSVAAVKKKNGKL